MPPVTRRCSWWRTGPPAAARRSRGRGGGRALLELIRGIRNARAEAKLDPATWLPVDLVVPQSLGSTLIALGPAVPRLARSRSDAPLDPRVAPRRRAARRAASSPRFRGGGRSRAGRPVRRGRGRRAGPAREEARDGAGQPPRPGLGSKNRASPRRPPPAVVEGDRPSGRAGRPGQPARGAPAGLSARSSAVACAPRRERGPPVPSPRARGPARGHRETRWRTGVSGRRTAVVVPVRRAARPEDGVRRSALDRAAGDASDEVALQGEEHRERQRH